MADSRSSQVRLPDDRSALRQVLAVESSTAPEHQQDDLTVISARGPLAERGEEALLRPLEVGKMLEGERLGQFVLQRYVGGGGMGVVFRALDTTLNREVAVKVLAHSQAHDEETLKRFQNEAQSAARLDHENIARVYYVGIDRGVHYIVFEFIEGINLRDLVQRDGPLSLADAISYTLQVAEALAHSSARDVIHRDIKPSNVLITPEKKAKLVDMGLARLHQVEHPDNDLTASGVTLGTFDYISPEQARDPRMADVRSDLYSLGCSFYFMLTGRPPFPEGTVLQKLLQHQGEDPVDPRQFRPELPSAIGAILAKLLAKNPARRYQTPAELIDDLGAVGLEGSTPRAVFDFGSARSHRPAAEPTWRRHLPWLVPVAVLVLFVLVHEYVYPRVSVAPSPLGQGNRSSAQPVLPRPALPIEKSSSQEDAPAPADVAPPAETDPPVEPTTQTPSIDLNNLVDQWRQLPYWYTVRSLLQPRNHNSGSGADTVTKPGSSVGAGLLGTSPPSSPNAAARRKGVLVVAPDRTGDGVYSSLQGAIGAASNGDVIELDFNGRFEERPLVFDNVRLTLRAAAERKPIVVFRPAEADALTHPRSMLVVTGGSLSLSGIELELEMPARVSTELWALIEIRRAERLQLERSTLTIHNTGTRTPALHPAVAFFDVKTPAGSDTMGIAGSVAPVDISLVDCVARGEATCLRTNEQEPVKLSWTRGVLATTETLLLAEANSGRAKQSSGVDIELDRVTALVQGGLARLANSEDLPDPVDTRIKCQASAIITEPNSPLVQHRGIAEVAKFQEHFQWTARNVDFEGTEIFWKITSTRSGDTMEWTFADWDAFWDRNQELGGRRGALPWLADAAAKKRLAEMTAADLVADQMSDSETSVGTGQGEKRARLPISTSVEAPSPDFKPLQSR